jgi:hypothetical protein
VASRRTAIEIAGMTSRPLTDQTPVFITGLERRYVERRLELLATRRATAVTSEPLHSLHLTIPADRRLIDKEQSTP